MARKRKNTNAGFTSQRNVRTKYSADETFDDSEDEFYAERDEILIDQDFSRNRSRRLKEQEKSLELSDEEVLRYDSVDETNSDDGSSSTQNEDSYRDDEDEEVWGASKLDYYNADVIETEADAIEEEAEARRLQQKQLKSMTDADFGLDESAWATDHEPVARAGPVVERLPEATIPANSTNDDKFKILRIRYPEFLPLTKDFRDLQESWTQLRQDNNFDKKNSLVKIQALLSYLGAIAMYFAILSSGSSRKAEDNEITAYPPDELRDHAIITNLIRTREAWETVKSTTFTTRPAADVETVKGVNIQRMSKDPGEQGHVKREKPTRKKRKRRHNGSPIIDGQSTSKIKPMPLQALLSGSVESSSDSDFGDENPLTEEQAQEKAKRKKGLRFYTSQIAQKANKRNAASRGAGGDDDVPHKERLKERNERLLKEAQKRGQQEATHQEKLDDNPDNGDDIVQDDEYYQTLVAESKRKKAGKQAKAEAFAEATRQGAHVYQEEVLGADGKRAITYAIQRNKGLMPKRNKDVRNPRVKKRKKFEEKKKKLGSIRQVYKGGEGRGGYGGELTGIKTNVVKSIKL